MSNTDREKCPYCKEDLSSELYQKFWYVLEKEFDHECPHCNKNIHVDVESIPVFICSMPKDGE